MSITRITGGDFITEADNWTVFCDNFDAQAGRYSLFTADKGTNYGTPEKDIEKETHYFKKGWWALDKEGKKEIKNAAIGDVVYFHLITKNIPDINPKTKKKSQVNMELYDYDGLFNPSDIIIKKAEYVYNNRLVYELHLSNNLLKFIKEDYGEEIELYFECSYEHENNIPLPFNTDLYLIVELCNKNDIKPFDKKQYGDCYYYRFRYEDFMKRHSLCNHMPPIYYFGEMRELSNCNIIDSTKDWLTPTLTEEMKKLNLSIQEIEKDGKKYKPIPSTSYGFKYCVRFSEVLMPELSLNGKKWLEAARYRLQKFMELGVIERNYIAKYDVIISDLLEDNLNDNFETFNFKTLSYELDKEKIQKFYTNIELDNECFSEFAFATHPDAYDPIEMKTLTALDLWKILLTPDISEWFDASTRTQALIMAMNLDYKSIGKSTIDDIKRITIEKIGKYIPYMPNPNEMLRNFLDKFIRPRIF